MQSIPLEDAAWETLVGLLPPHERPSEGVSRTRKAVVLLLWVFLAACGGRVSPSASTASEVDAMGSGRPPAGNLHPSVTDADVHARPLRDGCRRLRRWVVRFLARPAPLSLARRRARRVPDHQRDVSRRRHRHHRAHEQRHGRRSVCGDAAALRRGAHISPLRLESHGANRRHERCMKEKCACSRSPASYRSSAPSLAAMTSAFPLLLTYRRLRESPALPGRASRATRSTPRLAPSPLRIWTASPGWRRSISPRSRPAASSSCTTAPPSSLPSTPSSCR